MRVQEVHRRIVQGSTAQVFGELEAMGTSEDRVWPAPKMPFVRTEGAMRVGVTKERHGIIRAVLQRYEAGRTIVWRARVPFLEGDHGFRVTEHAPGQQLVEHFLDARIRWWFAPIWRLKIARVHFVLVERLLERLVQATGGTTEPLHVS